MQEKENRKTIIYIVIAAVALIIAWEPWRQISTAGDVPKEIGTKLFGEDFKNPLAAKSIEIVRFDEDNATIRPFKVAQVNGLWSIPSHSNYPADAQDHMAQAATALLDLEIQGAPASSNPGDQELYGVITPDPTKLKPGMTGVGTRVTIKDDKDNVLADIVIGKDVKDQPALRYVRRADRDQIYRVAIKTDKLSTKFEDWIEKDLLKLAAFDVRQVELNDYSTQEGVRADGRPGLGINQRSKMKLAYDDAKSNWSLVEMSQFDQKGQPVPAELAEDEELNNEKLNNLKTALDDLLIVDVERKPQGLSQDLRASDDFVKNAEALQSLAERGFYPASRGGDQLEIFSSEGEATCTTKDGVRYVLRFGNLAGGSESKDDEKPDEKGAKKPALNRFLFVMAQFDENQIPKPQLEPIEGEEPASEAKPAEGEPATDEAKASDEKAEEQKPAADKAEVPQKKTGAQETKTDEPAGAAEVKDEKPATEEKAAEKPKDEAAATADEEKMIVTKKENKRKQDEYNDAVKKGQDKVKELNDRFADWYFIISDDVYKKIHLGRADIVKKKELKEAADAAKGWPGNELDDLQKSLKAGGLKPNDLKADE